jgi:ComF family protein
VVPGLCGPCREPSRAFRRARALTVYEERVRVCLHALKFQGRRRLASVLGRMAAERWLGSGEISPGAAVIPVPLSAGRRRERGYNQAELVARALAPKARVPLLTRSLVKVHERPPQSGLSARARRRNASAAYAARLPPWLEGAHLLLVDDVFTTGATVDAAARALLAAGAGSVDVLTLSRVPRAGL